MTLTVALPELTNSNLRDALFSPRSVAIVGQSDDASKAGGRPLKFLRRIGYAGRVYPINPRRETVLGERAWPTLAALPEPQYLERVGGASRLASLPPPVF